MKRLLLVVDYQKDFVDGALGFPGAEALDGPIAAKIAACRAGYDRVELAGLVSYLCVLSNAIMVKAALPEAEIVVDAACTAGPDPALHAKGLDVMEALQITVLNR